MKYLISANIGGSHLIWDLEPDICVLGKALGNGHPIGAIVGKKEIMDAAQSTFISSSYWTERSAMPPLATVSVLKIKMSVVSIKRVKNQKAFQS